MLTASDSEPTALAAGLGVGWLDLQTVWPIGRCFLIDFALELDCFSCWTTTSKPAASAVGSLIQPKALAAKSSFALPAIVFVKL